MTDLACSASHHLAKTGGRVDYVLAAGQDRALRGAESLRHAERDRIDMIEKRPHRLTRGDRRVEQPTSIEMNGQAEFESG